MEEKNIEKFHTTETERGNVKFTEAVAILSPEQQKEIADWLKIDIEGLDPEKAQEKIDQEIAKEFGIRTVMVISLGKFEKAKFILVKNNFEKDEYWFLLAGPVGYHQEFDRLTGGIKGTKKFGVMGLSKLIKKKIKRLFMVKVMILVGIQKKRLKNLKRY